MQTELFLPAYAFEMVNKENVIIGRGRTRVFRFGEPPPDPAWFRLWGHREHGTNTFFEEHTSRLDRHKISQVLLFCI